jgi:hypothetical protein
MKRSRQLIASIRLRATRLYFPRQSSPALGWEFGDWRHGYARPMLYTEEKGF